MSAADKRVAELLERWLTSVELHAGYLSLDDAAYAKAQDWPKHQRPTRWVVELARARLLELERIVADRRSRGDTEFADALERMAFLANLLGAEHVERFIPLAQPPTPKRAARPAAAVRPAAAGTVEPTVEARVLRKAASPKTARRGTPRREAVADELPTPDAKVVATVVGDAVRLMSWGREWPQLAGLIARLANRPPEAEVWKVLRAHRAAIEAQARRPRG